MKFSSTLTGWHLCGLGLIDSQILKISQETFVVNWPP